jgi:DNA-directed RNA polymerase specialized sigma24 family protein
VRSPRGDDVAGRVQGEVEDALRDPPGGYVGSIEAIREFEALDEAKRVERMAEAQIVERLRQEGFDQSSPVWQAFAGALAEYGYVVLLAWAITGTLPMQAARHAHINRARVPSHLRLDGDEAHSLVAEILIVSLERFRTRSLSRWSPTAGASLRTFFIGRCLMDFGDVYEVWHRRERRPYLVDHLVDDGRFGARPAEEAEARVLSDQLMDQLLDNDPGLREVLELRAAGYRLGEIAAKLGTTIASVRSRTYRLRRSLSKEGLDG